MERGHADPTSNIANLPAEELAGFRYMRDLPRVAKPGAMFNYNTGETNIAGAILRKAVGKNLSDYVIEKVFLPGEYRIMPTGCLANPTARNSPAAASVPTYGTMAHWPLCAAEFSS